MSNAILFDSSRCSGCKGCQVACKCWNGLPSPMGKNANKFTGSYQSPADLNGDTRLIVTFDEKEGGPNGIEWAFGRKSCMHCIDPACANICPAGALYVDEATGLVSVNEENCIGCQYCSSVCPFDVPRYHGAMTKVNKCTGCIDRVAQGRVPACVQTCPPEALKFGERDEMIAFAKERVAYLHKKGFDKAALYGVDEMNGLGVIMVMKYDRDAYGLPENPEISPMASIVDIMKPLTAVGMGALVLGLGFTFLSGMGYKRPTMKYDIENNNVIDADTGEIIKHTPSEKERATQAAREFVQQSNTKEEE